MNGNELLRKLRRVGKRKGFRVWLEMGHGKGSHGMLYFGDRETMSKDRKKEIGAGLLASMLNDLGILKNELDE